MRQGSWPNLTNVSLEISISNTVFLSEKCTTFLQDALKEKMVVFNALILQSYCKILVRSEAKELQHPATSVYLLTNSTRNTTITYN